MRSVIAIAGTALLAATTKADLCALGSQEIGGNWYCQAVDTIQYANFGSSGSYNAVTDMNSETGTCSSEPQAYSGSLAPLDGEVSLHFRGPLALKQLAFYAPGSGATKAKRHGTAHKNHKRHGHQHMHHNVAREIEEAEKEKRGTGDWVVMTMDGKVVSWQNEYAGSAATPTPAPVASSSGSFAGNAGKVVSSAVASTGNSGSSGSSNTVEDTPSYSGDWVQQAYYNAASGTAQGLTFLNHNGGSGSGVFDYKFGNSLSYASADGCSGAASPQTLADTTLPSNKEVVVMSNKPCSGSSCGYVRPGTVAMHGFGGDQKIFIAELSMPDDGTSGWNMNMPAFWMLNAQIPRTLQYGQADCSCWESGCGEFDIMEVLDSGDSRCKSTLHAGVAGGDSDYFDRPTGAPIKVALVMSAEKATIQLLNSDFDISKTLTNEQVENIGSHSSGGLLEDLTNLGVSLFTLG